MPGIITLFTLLILGIPVVGFANNETEPTCWEAIQEELSPGIAANLACVLENASNEFLSLCSADGASKAESFTRYVSFRSKYEEILAEADRFFSSNPGATQLPPRIASEI